MKTLELENPKDLKITSAFIHKDGEESFLLEIHIGKQTETYYLGTENACKSKLTRDKGKGAKWVAVKEIAPVEKVEKKSEEKKERGRPANKKPVAIKSKPARVKESKATDVSKVEDSSPKKVADIKTEKVEEVEIGSFEIEADEDEKEAAKIKAEKSKKEIKKVEVTKTITPLKTDDPAGMDDFSAQISEITVQTIKIKSIDNDTSNELARKLGKELSGLKKKIDDTRLELNKPLQDAIKSNNAVAKGMTDPLEKEIGRVKALIGSYEQEKERERQKELAKAEKQKADAEKLELAETKRVERIRTSIANMETDLATKIEAVRTSAALTIISQKLADWTPKEEFYQEFMPQVLEVVEGLHVKINNRYDLVVDYEAAVAEGDSETANELSRVIGGIAVTEKEEAVENMSESETEDFKARQQLITVFTQMGVENVAANVERVIGVYGSAQLALEKKDEMLEGYRIQKEATEKEGKLKKEKMKNQRVEFKFQVMDKSKIPLEYLAVDEVAIRAAIKSNGQNLVQDMESFKIDGVVITKELKTVLR